MLQVQASQATIQRILKMLREARFLDARSEVVQSRFLTYNDALETLATVELQLHRGSNGAFHSQV